MATDARGHTVPAGSDAFDPQGSDVALSLSINDVVMAANATDRASKVAAIAPTTTRPLLVLQTDTLEMWLHTGTTGSPYSPKGYSWWGETTAQISVGTATATTVLTVALPATAPAGTYEVDADIISWAGATATHFGLLTFAGVALTGNSRSIGGSSVADVARSKHVTYVHAGGAANVVLQVQVNGAAGYCQAGTSMLVTWMGA